MLQSALFTYKRRVRIGEGDGEDAFAYNDNYINPLNVISSFWSVNESGQKVLSVWLANNYSVNFSEAIGKKFIDHMEDFLRYMIWGRSETTTAPQRENRPRRTRMPIVADVVEEIHHEGTVAQFVE